MQTTASITGFVSLYNRTDSREMRRIHVSKTKTVDLPPGDGNASIEATRGFKIWWSDRERGAGMTVEATMSVKLTCSQAEKSIRAAGEDASRLAESEAMQGIEEMELHIDSFAKKLQSGR